MTLTEEQKKRYHRHLILENMGEWGQEKMSRARILVIGAGGLGSPAIFYLAASGIGTIGIADPDTVSISNLQRQILYTTDDIGEKKALIAEKRVRALNPTITTRSYECAVDETNIHRIMEVYDFVIDGTDSFRAKFLINDACVSMKKPFVHGGVHAYEGQVMTVLPGQSACYRCVFQSPPPRGVNEPETLGILSPLPGILGAIQATEAIKFVIGKGELLTNRLFVFDARNLTSRIVPVKRRQKCRACQLSSGESHVE